MQTLGATSFGLLDTVCVPVTWQALSELERVKRQLKQPYATKETIAASISRLEDGIRRQAQVQQACAQHAPSADMQLCCQQPINDDHLACWGAAHLHLH